MRSRLAFRIAVAVLLFLGARAPGTAQEDLTAHPGFVDFGVGDLFSEDDLDIHVSVKDPLLDLVAEATRDSEPDLAAMMSELRAIEVYVYNLPASRRDEARKLVSRIADRLAGQGWETLITLRRHDTRSYVFLRRDGGTTAGLAALSVDEGEAVFINIVGAVDPARIGRLARKFKLEMLSEVVDQDPSTDGKP